MMRRRSLFAPVLGLLAPTLVACSDADSNTTTGVADVADGADGTDGSTDTASPDATNDDTSGDIQQSPGDDALACVPEQLVVTPVRSRVMWVLDKSGSMALNTWDHDLDSATAPVSRWKVLHEALEAVTKDFDAHFEFGAHLSPSTEATNTYGPAACLVEELPDVPVGPMSAAALMAFIPSADATGVAGSDPLSAALKAALSHLVVFGDEAPKAVVLVTDGTPNCREDAGDVKELLEGADLSIAKTVGDMLADEGIPTYVVGLNVSKEMTSAATDGAPDNVVPSTVLNTIAVAGGRSTGNEIEYFEVEQQSTLAPLLSDVLGSIRSCTVKLDPLPTDPARLKVTVNGSTVEAVKDCDEENGWTMEGKNG